MTIIHIRKARRSARWWAMVAASLIAAGMAAGWLATGRTRPSFPEPTNARTAGCCEGQHARWRADAASGPVAPFMASAESASRVSAPPSADGTRGAMLYDQALHYLDCQDLTEADREGAQDTRGLYQLDPSGALASEIDHAAQARRESCRSVGPQAFLQVDSLMRESARLGNRPAAFFLLEREVLPLVEHAAEARAEGHGADDAALSAAMAKVESMAFDGNPDAMVLAGQLLVGGQLGKADPVRASAWNLVALQLRLGAPLSEDNLGESGLLASLTDEEAAQALQQAESLRSQCCAGPVVSSQ